MIKTVNTINNLIKGNILSNRAYLGSNRVFPIDGSIDNTFEIGTGFNDITRATKTQTDGKIIVGGVFTSYNGTGRNRIVRLNTDGSIDNTFSIGTGFDSAINSNVDSIEIQNDGKIIVTGPFTSYNGNARNRIVRLNTDGSLDNTFSIGTGFNDFTRLVEIQTDGKIIVVGLFTNYNNNARNRIVRLNTDGSIDNTFSIGTGFNNITEAVKIQPDGKIIVVGNFTSYNGNARNRIVRLYTDGSLDNTFSIGTGFDDFSPRSTKIQTDGKLIVTGEFTSYNSIIRNGIIRLNTDGSIDNTFSIGTGFNSFTQSTKIQTDGKIIVGGAFVNYNGAGRNYLVRLNTNGSIDNTFSIGTGFNGFTRSTKIQADGKLIVTGNFTSYNGNARNRIVRLYI